VRGLANDAVDDSIGFACDADSMAGTDADDDLSKPGAAEGKDRFLGAAVEVEAEGKLCVGGEVDGLEEVDTFGGETGFARLSGVVDFFPTCD
jgi:hypothetical protein